MPRYIYKGERREGKSNVYTTSISVYAKGKKEAELKAKRYYGEKNPIDFYLTDIEETPLDEK